MKKATRPMTTEMAIPMAGEIIITRMSCGQHCHCIDSPVRAPARRGVNFRLACEKSVKGIINRRDISTYRRQGNELSRLRMRVGEISKRAATRPLLVLGKGARK